MYEAYSTPAFEEQYTYHGTDLGAIWTPEKTAFRLWAPTAEDVTINIYRRGTPGTDDLLTQLQIKGVELTASGLSKLEGQIRSVNDYELVAIAEVLGVTLNWLVGKED